MNSKMLMLLIISFLSTLVMSNFSYSITQDSQEALPSQPSYIPGELIIKLKIIPPKINKRSNGIIETGLPSIDVLNSKFNINSMEKILEKHEKLAEKTKKLDIFKKHGLDRIYLLKMPRDADITKIVNDYKNDINVEYIEPNYIYSTQLIPNDPSFSNLYGLHNTGQSGGKVDADIDAPEAWDIKKESNNIVIAVIDTGIDYNHADLAANIWVNSGEIPGNNIDDDNNGFIDDVHGFDFYNKDNDPMDDNRHGTHVAGTIAAVGNNNIGIVGVNWQAKIMALKFLNASGRGTTSGAVSSVLYASLMGAKILSNSWGGGSYSQALYDAISAANAAGILFVAAAGNNNLNNDIYTHYPSSYNIPNVVTVASITSSDQRSSFSNYGSLSIDIAAPGSNIYSTMPNNGYGYLSGTSMATPHVSGVFGLVFSNNAGLSIWEARSTVEDVTDYIITDKPIGGRLNAYNALFPRSKISNEGSYQIKGYLSLKSQVLSGTDWQDIGPNINDLLNNNLRVIELTDILNIRQPYNNLNFVPPSTGHYRILARFTDKDGNVIATNNGLLEDSYEFDVITSTTSTTTSTSITTTIANTLNFYPLDDAFTFEANPAFTYDRNDLIVGGDSSRFYSYLKFDVNTIQIITEVKLLIRTITETCNTGTPSTPCLIISSTNNNWNESTINWQNQPPVLNQINWSTNLPLNNTYYTIDVSPYIRTNGLYSIVLTQPLNFKDILQFYSGETSYRPYLRVKYATTSTTSTSTTSSTTTTSSIPTNGFNFTAVEDAPVYEINPSGNYWSSSYLQVSGILGSRKNSYIKFNVTGLTNNVYSAKLFLTNVVNTQCSAILPPKCINLFSVPNLWSEYSVTWNNKPQFGSLLGSTDYVPAYGKIFFDLTGNVNSNGVYSFGINTTLTNNTGILFYSKDAAVGSSFKPALQIKQS